MPSCTSAPSRRRPIPAGGAGGSYVQRKSTEQVRNRLVGLLHLPDLYALDRLDLTVETSIDTDTQARVANVMERLSDPAFLRSAGMYGHGLLTAPIRRRSRGASCCTSAATAATMSACTPTA